MRLPRPISWQCTSALAVVVVLSTMNNLTNGLVINFASTKMVSTAHAQRHSSSCSAYLDGTFAPRSNTAGCTPVSFFHEALGQRGETGVRERRRDRSHRGAARMVAYNPNDELRAIVQRKQYEVKSLLAAHTATDDRLQMRLSFGASESCYALREALRRNKGQTDDHRTVVVADMKRRSPTSAELPPDVNAFDDSAAWAAQLHAAGSSVLMVNTDGPSWGGSMSDLDAVLAHFKSLGKPAPPVVMKDIIVHPMQMAQALEKGAAATVLIACVLGPALRDMMDVATTMGTEAIVEVHTPAECEKALEHGANVIMVNNWDRITGKLYPKQALALRHMIPDQILTMASGGIDTTEQAYALSDEGYDAVVLGRSLVSGGGGATRGGGGGITGPELIRGIVDRVGVPRDMLGWGVKAEDLDAMR